jgi:hypothetical protein
MQRAIQKHEDGTAKVIPVILHPCDWRSTLVLFYSNFLLYQYATGINLTPEFTCILERSGKMSGVTICYVIF